MIKISSFWAKGNDGVCCRVGVFAGKLEAIAFVGGMLSVLQNDERLELNVTGWDAESEEFKRLHPTSLLHYGNGMYSLKWLEEL